MSTILELAIRDCHSDQPTTSVKGLAPVEAVGRLLGYSEKELTLADNVLSGFAWQYPTEPPHQDANSAV
jgi:hypothetical protein